jgi:HNH endonuclease
MNSNYILVADRANHRCEYYHAPELVFNFPFEVEHIIPVSRKGADSEENLALACRSCNLRKGNRLSNF